MFTKGIMPYLDVNNGRVVKNVNFVNLRNTGDLVEMAAAYDRAGANELVFLDIATFSDNRRTVVDIVRKVTETVFIPFTVGGGIRMVEDFHMLLQEGMDKISINSSAIDNPRLINDSTDKFNRQRVVVTTGARHRVDRKSWNIYKHGGRVDVGVGALEQTMEAGRLGAGEILLTSMDYDETRSGYDDELTSLITSHVSVPVIASKDTENKEHFYGALTEGGADAVPAASLFHYKELEIRDLERYLSERGIAIRI